MSIEAKLETTKKHLVDSLYSFIYEKINDNLELEDSFTVATFFKMFEFKSGSFEDQVFYSTYNKEILSKVSRRLYYKGLSCNISFNGKKVTYSTRVVNFKKYFLFLSMFLSMFSVGVKMGMDYTMTPRDPMNNNGIFENVGFGFGMFDYKTHQDKESDHDQDYERYRYYFMEIPEAIQDDNHVNEMGENYVNEMGKNYVNEMGENFM